MPAIDDQNRLDQPMTFRGKDGRVYKTAIMEIKARDAVDFDDARNFRTWFGSLLRSPD